MTAEGHDLGQRPPGLDWGELLEAWRARTGGWTALAEELVRRVGAGAEVPRDLGSVERGLRRLAERGQRPGGQYGRWVARYLGVPTELGAWLRGLGQYHRRFADLPVPLRRAQLAIWDRPPVSETPAGVWIDLGMASVALRDADPAGVTARLGRAGPRAAAAGVAAELELGLFRARVASDAGEREAERAAVERVEALLEDPRELEATDAACYRSRVIDARAYRLSHPHEGAPDHEGARRCYQRIDEASGVPFVDFRRAMGLAYCAWKLGDSDGGVTLALEAAEHAADGGFVRLRVMAVNLASRAAESSRDATRAAPLRARAAKLAELLEDEELRARVRRP